MGVVRLDHKGIAEALRTSVQIRENVERLAEQVAANVRSQAHHVASGDELPVDVSMYTTDRPHAVVVIAHPAGVGMQAKYGVLTKAAAAAGLEVVDR